MYTQVFGNYLLNTGAVTKEQLLTALEAQSSTHASLGAWAIHKGYMTAVEAQRIFILQTHQDKLFGELAIAEGYLTQEQVDELLQAQGEIPGYMLLGQVLMEQGVITAVQLEDLVTGYRSEYEIYDLEENDAQNDIINHLLADIDTETEGHYITYINDYLILLFNNLIRFIGDDFTPLNVIRLSSIPTNHCISQHLHCDLFQVDSVLNMESDVAVAFASRYAQDQFEEYDEYVQASMEDFLNLHNGLFVVNESNDHSLEVSLDPPKAEDREVLDTTGKLAYMFPILYPFGTVHFIFTLYNIKELEENPSPAATKEGDVEDLADLDLDALLDEVNNTPTGAEDLNLDLDPNGLDGLLDEIAAKAEQSDEKKES